MVKIINIYPKSLNNNLTPQEPGKKMGGGSYFGTFIIINIKKNALGYDQKKILRRALISWGYYFVV